MYARVINPGEAREGRSGWLAGLFGLANGGSEQLLAVRASFLSPRCQGLPRGSCTPRQYCHAVPSPTYIITYPRPQQPPTAPAPSRRPRGSGPSTARRCAPECGQAYYEPESDPAQGRPPARLRGRHSAGQRAGTGAWADMGVMSPYGLITSYDARPLAPRRGAFSRHRLRLSAQVYGSASALTVAACRIPTAISPAARPLPPHPHIAPLASHGQVPEQALPGTTRRSPETHLLCVCSIARPCHGHSQDLPLQSISESCNSGKCLRRASSLPPARRSRSVLPVRPSSPSPPRAHADRPPHPGTRASSRTAPPASSTRPSSAEYTNSSSRSATPASSRTMSSMSSMRIRTAPLTSRSSSARSPSPAVAG